MNEIKINTSGAELCFTPQENDNQITAILTRLDGNIPELSVPAQVECENGSIPVTAIGRKALMGNRRLQELILPETLARIEDWALAGCRRLKEVTMPRVHLGKGVFQDCEGLRKIRFSDGGSEDVPRTVHKPSLVKSVCSAWQKSRLLMEHLNLLPSSVGRKRQFIVLWAMLSRVTI